MKTIVIKGFQQQLSKEDIKLAMSGNLAALETIYHTYVDASYSLAYRITYNSVLAEDVTQDAFVKVFKHINAYDFKGSFAGWIRRIVVNESINSLKSKHQLNILLDNDIADNEPAVLFNDNSLINNIDLDYFLEKLPETSRIVMILHEIEGYKHKEVAAMFNKSASFSKMTLKRAYNELQQLVKVQEKNYALK